ncbi:hypothetical protein N431DRAFT_430912 [Stipitochalara longipes BDJ]|nr:hypothetical protein N431DRAFT_430912 [Stipitochalara longipes BDJ]
MNRSGFFLYAPYSTSQYVFHISATYVQKIQTIQQAIQQHGAEPQLPQLPPHRRRSALVTCATQPPCRTVSLAQPLPNAGTQAFLSSFHSTTRILPRHPSRHAERFGLRTNSTTPSTHPHRPHSALRSQTHFASSSPAKPRVSITQPASASADLSPSRYISGSWAYITSHFSPQCRLQISYAVLSEIQTQEI